MTRQPRTARAKARAELTREIKHVARRQLAEHGAAALSLRAVAREIGLVSASALYRYYPSRDALLTTLIIDSYDALGEAAEHAEAAVHDQPILRRWLAISHRVRAWALDNPHEYALIYGSPVPGYAAPTDTVRAAARIPLLLGTLLPGLSTDTHLTDPPAFAITPALHTCLSPVLATMPPGVTDDRMIRGLMAWTYLFGAVSLEVFGHRHNVIDQPSAFFDHEMQRISHLLALQAPPATAP
jgi:AcrR family transcriptional regulator